MAFVKFSCTLWHDSNTSRYFCKSKHAWKSTLLAWWWFVHLGEQIEVWHAKLFFSLVLSTKPIWSLLILPCLPLKSHAVLSSHGHPLPHGWVLQRGEGRLREVQTLHHKALPSPGHQTRQGLCACLFFRTSSHPAVRLTPPSFRCESGWFSLGPFPAWSLHWTCTPPNQSWWGTWRRSLTGLFLSQQTHSSYYHFDFHTTEVIELDKTDAIWSFETSRGVNLMKSAESIHRLFLGCSQGGLSSVCTQFKTVESKRSLKKKTNYFQIRKVPHRCCSTGITFTAVQDWSSGR